MKTNKVDESIGYITAINDVIRIIKKTFETKKIEAGNPKKVTVDVSELIDAIVRGQRKINWEDGEYYTMDKIDPKKPFKAIAGEDALFLNPVYELNKNK